MQNYLATMMTVKRFTWILALSLTCIILGGAVCFTACTKPKPLQITGLLSIKPELEKSILPTAAIYVVARAAERSDGPPLAVKRYQFPFNFPITFSMSAKDAMLPDAKFTGKIRITARVAQSGAATPQNTGDLELSKPMTVNLESPDETQKPIELILDQIKK